MKNHKLIPIFFLFFNFLILNCFEPCSLKSASIYVLSEGSSLNTDLKPKGVGYYQITATSAGIPIKVYVYIKPENRELTDISLFSPEKSLISWDSINYDSMKMRYVISITPRSTGKYLLSIENKDDYSIDISTSYILKPEKSIRPKNTEKPSSRTSPPVNPKPNSSDSSDTHINTSPPISSKTAHPNPTKTTSAARTASPNKIKTPLPIHSSTPSPVKTSPPARTDSPINIGTQKTKPNKTTNHTTSTSSSKKKRNENITHTHTSKPEKTIDIKIDLTEKHPVFRTSLIFLHTNPEVLSRFSYILKPELISAVDIDNPSKGISIITDEILTYNNIKITVLDPNLASYNSGYICAKKSGITTVVAISEERIIDCFTLRIFDKEEGTFDIL